MLSVLEREMWLKSESFISCVRACVCLCACARACETETIR